MFVINITYKVGLDKVDEEIQNHVAFLKKYYSLSYFLASGRKVPRNGGVILAQAKDQKELLEIIQQDPFYQKQLADYEITEFIPTMTSDPLHFLKEA